MSITKHFFDWEGKQTPLPVIARKADVHYPSLYKLIFWQGKTLEESIAHLKNSSRAKPHRRFTLGQYTLSARDISRLLDVTPRRVELRVSQGYSFGRILQFLDCELSIEELIVRWESKL
ncbi:hypothetical protein ACNAUY_07820 [Acinetobacter tibetensis]|uniref:hypothetical protein n=1 Tax=Acinetobacter tibetensis TaxID=2943497 RepID=UPI003A4D5ADA